MNKDKLRHLICEQLKADLDQITQSAKESMETATHDENIPDNKYDTLSLEASYLARGQAKRVVEVELALEAYQHLSLKPFDSNSPIYLTALVTLESEDGIQNNYFLGPEAGGMIILYENKQVTLITPNAPISQQLIGKVEGDCIELKVNKEMQELEIIQVQ